MRNNEKMKQKKKELIIDNFAGGGGTSIGLEMAGLHVDIAINHDIDAVRMHKMNHPNTKHFCEDIFEVDPRIATRGNPVGLAWFSPDCKHFSKAKGSTPVSKKIRGLAWVALKWAATVKPRVIILENVEEFKTWGPLIETSKGTFPDPEKKGETFQFFVKELQKHGYKVEWKELSACDFGAPTTRKRLFLIARNDNQAIRWPKPTHAPSNSLAVIQGKLKPYRTAFECIDWEIPGKSIFNRKKLLSTNTMKRIARGLKKFVIDKSNPCIIPTQDGLITPNVLVNTSNHPGSDVSEPLKTITTGNHHALIQSIWVPYIIKQYGGNYSGAGISLQEPLHTITQVDHHTLCTVQLDKHIQNNNDELQSFLEEYNLPQNIHVDSQSFLIKYYGCSTGQSILDPVHTIPTKDRFGLVNIESAAYQIIDIKFRMLQPHELSKAQGLPASYILDTDHEGKKISKSKQVARIGNMVVPQIAKALAEANIPELCKSEFTEQIELLNADAGWNMW